jgi:hypothetical protein
MCKAVDRGMVMGDVNLLERSGAWIAEKQTLASKVRKIRIKART